MKTLHLSIIVISVSVIFILYPSQSYGSGYYPCCIESNLDKTEYNPGDTAKITVTGTGNYDNSNGEITVKISDVTFGPDYTNVVYQTQKTLQNGKAELEYKTPQSSDRYRYLLTVESPAGVESKMFFTKKDASKIIISDVKLLAPKVKQGEQIKLEARIVDGVGNPIHYLRVSANSQVPTQNCPDQEAGVGGDMSPLYSIQPRYWSEGIINGTIPVSDTAKPGTYDLVIGIGSNIAGYSSTQTTTQFQIIETDHRDKPYALFGIFSPHFGSGFMTQSTINITGTTNYNQCGPALPHVSVKAEIKRYDMQKSTHIETLKTKETVSDENGIFHISFDPIGLRTGYYTIILTATYQGIHDTRGSEMPHNIKNFIISTEGKNFTVMVDSWYFIPLNATFDKENKKLTLDLNTSDSFRRVDFTIPSELLDGKFTVLVNGQERDGVIRNYDGYSSFSPWPSEDNHTTIEIIGTSAIPEFPLYQDVFVISIMSMILFYKIKFRK